MKSHKFLSKRSIYGNKNTKIPKYDKDNCSIYTKNKFAMEKMLNKQNVNPL